MGWEEAAEPRKMRLEDAIRCFRIGVEARVVDETKIGECYEDLVCSP